MEKEKWKDDVLESLTGLKPAEPDAFLFTRIETRLKEKTGFSTLQVQLAGVAMVLLLAINIWAITSYDKVTSSESSITTTYSF